MNDYEEHLKAQHGEAVLYEDRGDIDMNTVQVDSQPCSAVDHLSAPCCTAPGIYRIFGNYRERHKGARWKQFNRSLCTAHLGAWATIHGTDVETLCRRKVK
jgi:hypothetical protein